MFGDVFNDMFRGSSTSGKENNGQKILKWISLDVPNKDKHRIFVGQVGHSHVLSHALPMSDFFCQGSSLNFLTGLVGRARNPVPALVRVHIYVGIDLKVLVRRLQ
jgi:hypothetical protein